MWKHFCPQFKVIIDSHNISQSLPISLANPLDVEAWKYNNLGHWEWNGGTDDSKKKIV